MGLGPEDRALIRRMVVEEIRRQMGGGALRPTPLAARPVVSAGLPPSGLTDERAAASSGPTAPSERRSPPPEVNRAAHMLADTQVGVGGALETALRDLDDLVVRAQTLAEKIRSTLRRTEPSGRGR
ncbi:hypothetical protein [Geochorda subterranea]|uniref:Uncharacterized protein n=1 Tax=Geochorda subterranea TaxID=3109564 RepID=A0ABZ1BSH6_9FIRM|nr:hypothetical protein [Limnochorda sp. LNt]WRP15513.1 hypothetical protein VLY81_04940 [Limnochorda sp. LNt]